MSCRGLVERRSRAWVLGLAALAAGTVLLAPVWRADDAAQTGRAARLSCVEGKVRIVQGSQVLADPALQNTPLFEGTQVSTSEDGRAELQFDDGSVVRLSPNSSLTLTVLRGQGGSGETEVVLESGLGYFELHGEGAAQPMRVRFGDSVVTASGVTVMRVSLDTPPGEVAVFSGNAHLERGPTVAVEVRGGESVTLNGVDPTQYNLVEWIEPDSWDTWNSDRDQALMSAETARTGAANSLPEKNNPAWNDLDANGNWYNVPDEGYVWSPYEAASPGFDPYGNGNWMWTPQYGYMWVSGYSWGYMPYQCGAWNYFNGFGWGWAPGGCTSWWGSGMWFSNIGYAPGGYHRPLRPRPLPPHGPIARPLKDGLAAVANPVVAVNRRTAGGTAGSPARDRNAVVTIAGHPVQPLRALSPRPLYNGSTAGYAGHSRPAYSDTGTSAGQRSTYGSVSGGSHPGSAGAAGSSGARPSTPAARPSTPAVRPSGGSGQHTAAASHSSSSSSRSSAASHVSSGGGGSHAGGGGSGHR
jgi:hypothetical protein